MSHQVSHLDQAVTEIRQRWSDEPRVGIILGTGMGKLAGDVESAVAIPYQDIPNFPRSTALSHKGRLVCGRLAGVPVVVMDGRCHLYEGYSADEITLPVRVMRSLGATMLIVGNASGGVNPRFAIGDIMLIDSHINLMWQRRAGCQSCGETDRSVRTTDSPYDPELIDSAMAIARRENFLVHRGVYVGVTGPNYETRAEYRCFRRIGGDAVGMSTVPEVVAAAGCGMKVLGLSTVTNVAISDAPVKVDPNEVVTAVESAESKLRLIVTGIVAEFAIL